MAEETELGSDLGQLADNLLWQMRKYLNAVHSNLAAVGAAVAAQAPGIPQPPLGEVDREEIRPMKVTGVKPPVGIGGHQPEP